MTKTKASESQEALRKQLVELLAGGGAHAKFDDVFKSIPPKVRGQKPPGLPHSPWMLLEHMRIAQWDILEFSRNAKHESPEWPEGYWPKSAAAPSERAWDKSLQDFRKDLKAMQDLVEDPETDLFEKISWGDGQTILRETFLVADHNAYHLAQMVDALRLLGAWKDE